MHEPNPRWSVMVHGGAKTISANRFADHVRGVEVASAKAADILQGGGSALDAVEAAVRALEDDPTFNAGLGSVLNADGEVEMDASIMEGEGLRIGAVGAVRRLKNPVTTARSLLDELPILLVAEGAERFALARGAATIDQGVLRAAAPDGPSADTVGCVALDQGGRLAVGLSTGGLSGKRPGRIGDSALPGCGFFADDAVGAVAFSGDGESIARSLLATRTLAAMPNEGADGALQQSLALLDRVGGEAGGIALAADGAMAVRHTSQHFAVGLASYRQPVRGGVSRAEFEDIL